MPSTRDYKNRIRSVKNTQQITRAMKLVAASKVRRAQERIENARPYCDHISDLVNSLALRIEEEPPPLLREIERTAGRSSWSSLPTRASAAPITPM